MRRIFCAVLGVLTPFYANAFTLEPEYLANQLIVRMEAHASLPMIQDVERYEVLVPSLSLYLLHLNPRSRYSVRSQIEVLRNRPGVIYASPDFKVTMRTSPNDPDFLKQWNYANTTSLGSISADQAWDFGVGGRDLNGNEIVVAVVDDGLDYNHPDLKSNVWTNTGEISGNGIDDDQNGYVDDILGWDAHLDKGGNLRVNYHGTHVAGTVGAKGANGLLVTGVNWDVKLMSVGGASGSISIVAKGYGYVFSQKKLWLETSGAKGANIVATNSSFGIDYADCRTDQHRTWNDLYEEMGRLGILSAVATANMDINVDQIGDVPSGCTSEYVISVTNTDRNDVKGRCGYGKESIDLSAPGTLILSTLPNGRTGTLSGTSMATPHVAGAIGFLYSVASPQLTQQFTRDPGVGALTIKKKLLSGVDPVESLKDKTVSGGRLNLYKAAAAVNSFAE
ncbi:MAG: S8 family peptidase [Pseudobdellovibrionaceae bacterium]